MIEMTWTTLVLLILGWLFLPRTTIVLILFSVFSIGVVWWAVILLIVSLFVDCIKIVGNL